jgi:hypothetical protein
LFATPPCEEVEDADDHRERREDEYSENARVHPLEGLPSAESGYVFITKVSGRAFDPPATA